MTRKINVGIIGTSWWTDSMYLPSLKSHDQANVVAVCGRNKDNAQKLATKYSVPLIFTDYKDLVNHPELDAIVIATPDDLHYPMALEALDKGLHVLCEKPMALNVNQAKEMYEKAEALQKKHMILFTYRFQPHFHYVKKLIKENYLGKILNADLYFIWGDAREPINNWQYDGDRSNGIIGTLGSHLIDLVHWYCGDISELSADLIRIMNRSEKGNLANDSAILNFHTADGGHGTIRATTVAYQAERIAHMGFKLYGENGTIEAELIFGEADVKTILRGSKIGEDRFSELSIPEYLTQGLDSKNPFDIYNKHSVGPRHFIDAMLNDTPVSPNFSDGLKVQKVIDAAIKSNEEKRWVSL